MLQLAERVFQQPLVVPGTISPIFCVGPSIVSFAVTELFSERLFALSVSFPALAQQQRLSYSLEAVPVV